MATQLYYFTGTGNTLWAARQLQALLPDCALTDLAALRDRARIAPQAEAVGLLFPLYFYGPPALVGALVERMELSACRYLFGVATCGAPSFAVGGAAEILNESLAPQSRALDLFAYLWMPGNYVRRYGAMPPWLVRWQLRRAPGTIAQIAEQVRAKAQHVVRLCPLLRPIQRRVYAGWLASLPKADAGFRANERCNRCGVCARVCPVEDIALVEGRPVWQGHCEQCMACIQSCPQEAIQHGDATQARRRYRNPQIPLRELFRR